MIPQKLGPRKSAANGFQEVFLLFIGRRKKCLFVVHAIYISSYHEDRLVTGGPETFPRNTPPLFSLDERDP